VKKDLPAVGANFQDHPTTLLLFSLSNQSFPNPDTIATNATYNATVWAEYLAHRTGPIASGFGNTIVAYSLHQLTSPADASSRAARLLAQDPLSHLPEIYATSPALLQGFLAQRAILARRFNSSDTAITATPFRGNGISPAPLLHPVSRGTVTLNPNLTNGGGGGLPTVQYHTFQNPLDAENVVSIVRRVRKFWASPAMAVLGSPPREIAPGEGLQTDEEILGKLRADRGVFWPSLAHPSGTCAMMPERLGGCVGADLRVYGVKGLRVVDASTVPLIVGYGLQATVYAVAEKAADLIKGGS
jgi:choline dehydrogenase-like flavoprotein